MIETTLRVIVRGDSDDGTALTVIVRGDSSDMELNIIFKIIQPYATSSSVGIL